jgi:putative cell wall-binding protein
VTSSATQRGARFLALLAATALAAALLPLLAAPADAAHFANDTRRVAGETRFETAVEIAREAFPDGAEDIVLARGDVFADALAGALLAGALDAPILLTQVDVLTPGTAEAIGELGATNVWLLGGEAAISDATAQQVGALGGVTTVVRIDGANRFDTARLVAAAATEDAGAEVGETEDGRTAILATGERFPDALAAGPLAYGGAHPLLLTATAFLSQEAEQALLDLDIDLVLVAGGTAAVGTAVTDRLDALGIAWQRVSGADRTHTAVRFAEVTRAVLYEPLTADMDPLAIASGREEGGGADALALAPLAARTQADLVIAGGGPGLDGAPEDGILQPSAHIAGNCEGFGNPPIVIAGGTAAISAQAEAEVQRLAVCTDFVPRDHLEVSPLTATNVIDPDEEDNNVHTLDLVGENALDEPADGAVILAEVYAEATEPSIIDGLLGGHDGDDASFYVEGDEGDERVFVLVERDTVVLPDGTATFDYALEGTDAREDRILLCALPNLTEDDEDRSCTDDEGRPNTRPDGSPVPYAQVTAEKRWVEADADGVFGFEISGEREVFFQDDDETNALGAAGGPAVGEARVLVNAAEEVVCLALSVDQVEGTFAAFEEATGLPASHIHAGTFDTNGPVVIAFPSADDATGTLRACVEADEELLEEIKADPDEYYVNLHTEVWTGGVARGQLDGSWDGMDRTGQPDDAMAAGDHGGPHAH